MPMVEIAVLAGGYEGRASFMSKNKKLVDQQ